MLGIVDQLSGQMALTNAKLEKALEEIRFLKDEHAAATRKVGDLTEEPATEDHEISCIRLALEEAQRETVEALQQAATESAQAALEVKRKHPELDIAAERLGEIQHSHASELA